MPCRLAPDLARDRFNNDRQTYNTWCDIHPSQWQTGPCIAAISFHTDFSKPRLEVVHLPLKYLYILVCLCVVCCFFLASSLYSILNQLLNRPWTLIIELYFKFAFIILYRSSNLPSKFYIKKQQNDAFLFIL